MWCLICCFVVCVCGKLFKCLVECVCCYGVCVCGLVVVVVLLCLYCLNIVI